MNLQHAIVGDIETYPNCFTLGMEQLYGDTKAVWEISHKRDDRVELMTFLQHLAQTQTPMIGFNNIHFDYPVLHFFMNNPSATVEQIYAKVQQIFASNDNYTHVIWPDQRYFPQIDLFKIHHFDNRAKSTSLKYLQINMRAETVIDLPIKHGSMLTAEQIDDLLIPYNLHDVSETKRFTQYSMDAINFRISLIPQFGIDVLNWNDTKIGEMTMIKRLGDELCYDRSTGRRQTRQTPRKQIAVNDIILPFIQFSNPEFQRVLTYLRQQVLQSEDFGYNEEFGAIKTKGVFTDLKATVGGIEFHFGTGGVHGSLEKKRVVATDEWLIRDIDVASLYPSIAIVNNLAPAHLGQAFVDVYSSLPKERKKWQQEKGKKCAEANSLKLAANGVYGKSNSMYSPFYDPQFTMQITINGQLMLCMLIERLATVPSLILLQANTDGVTYYVHRDHEPTAAQHCRDWEALTKLTLEDVNYKRMFLRDVNSYIAEAMDGSLKCKGAYWAPDPLDYEGSVANAQPPAWHRDLGNSLSIRAAVAHMVHGVSIEQFIRMCTNPYDFMMGIKTRRGDTLIYNCPVWGEMEQQRNTRFYVAKDKNAGNLIKRAPSLGKPGAFKKANGVSDSEYARVMAETGGMWDERVCTKNKSRYEQRESNVCAGYKVNICNDVKDFDFNSIDYSFYIHEATKLVI